MTAKDANTTEQELILTLQQEIDRLLNEDILSDVPIQPTCEELDALIAVELGQAYNITIDRKPLPTLHITVRQSSTVQDIKRLIKIQVDRSGPKRKISWKYIWHSYCLAFGQTRLLNDKAVVSQLGIKQHSVLTFSRLAHEKGQHRKAKKHYAGRRPLT